MTDTDGTGPPQGQVFRVPPQPVPFSVITSNHGFTPDGQALVRLEFTDPTGSKVYFAPVAYLDDLIRCLEAAKGEAPKIQIAPAGALPGLSQILGGKK